MIQIDSAALSALRTLAAALPETVAGLRLVPSGDACQGWQLHLMWCRQREVNDLCWSQEGVTLIADRRHWPTLQGCEIVLAERHGEPGLNIRLQPAGCQCERGSCSPAEPAQLAG